MSVNTSMYVYAKNCKILVFLLFYHIACSQIAKLGKGAQKISVIFCSFAKPPSDPSLLKISSYKIIIITNSVTVDIDENQHPHYTMMTILMFSLGGETNTHVWPKQRPSWQPRIICPLLKNLLEQCTAA